ITNYELRITNYELRMKMQMQMQFPAELAENRRKIQIQLRITNYEFSSLHYISLRNSAKSAGNVFSFVIRNS
ncbi:MAG: hypothetical protein LBI60_03110, partial [Bacteroidales bacterium]|nr:hypothetical protein [Bacteroidales bacterium]